MTHNENDIKKVIGNLFTSDKKLARGYNEFNVEQLWRDSFGEMISQYTSQVRFNKGQLTVYITSSALKQELMLNKESVINKLNGFLKYNKIVSIRIC